MLPSIEPISEACVTVTIVSTISGSLEAAYIANPTIISSAALPNVAFRKPPMASPVLNAISSVPFPIKNANGIMAIIEKRNAIVRLCW